MGKLHNIGRINKTIEQDLLEIRRHHDDKMDLSDELCP